MPSQAERDLKKQPFFDFRLWRYVHSFGLLLWTVSCYSIHTSCSKANEEHLVLLREQMQNY